MRIFCVFSFLKYFFKMSKIWFSMITYFYWSHEINIESGICKCFFIGKRLLFNWYMIISIIGRWLLVEEFFYWYMIIGNWFFFYWEMIIGKWLLIYWYMAIGTWLNYYWYMIIFILVNDYWWMIINLLVHDYW